jgi:molecular chaperone DnaJ
MGGPGRRGGPSGDLLVRVHVGPHPSFERQGLDLKTRATVDMVTAVLGGKVSIPLLQGRAEMRIPEGSQPGQVFRLAGQGLLDKSGRRGDLLVTLRVDIPRKLSDKQRALLKKFAED